MRDKLKLEIDQLAVESFDTDAEGLAQRGTVAGFESWETVNDATCHGYGTCGIYPCKEVP